jgi:hypothetical protein
MVQLVRVEHDPFATDPMSGHLHSIHTELALTAKKLGELVAMLDAIGAAAHQFDAIMQVEIRKVAEIVDNGAVHFDEKLDALRADFAAMKRVDTGAHIAKLESAIKKVQGMATDLANLSPAHAPAVPIEIERDKTGKPVRVKKGDQMFAIERENGHVIGMRPEGQGKEPTPKRPGASKRFQN